MKVWAQILIWMRLGLGSVPVHATGALYHIQWQISRKVKGEHDLPQHRELL